MVEFNDGTGVVEDVDGSLYPLVANVVGLKPDDIVIFSVIDEGDEGPLAQLWQAATAPDPASPPTVPAPQTASTPDQDATSPSAQVIDSPPSDA